MKKYVLIISMLLCTSALQALELKADKDLSKTLAEVKNIINEDGYPVDGITVWLEPENYNFTETLHLDKTTSGTKDSPLEFKVLGEGKAIFSGGTELEVGKSQRVRDAKTLNRLSEKARGKVYSLSIEDDKLVKMLSDADARLSMNGQMLKLSRYPNIGYAHVNKILEMGTVYAHGRTLGDPPKYSLENPIGGLFNMADKDTTAWEKEFAITKKARVIGYMAHDCYKEVFAVGSIEDGKIKAVEYSRYGFADIQKLPRRVILLNLLCELDEPGEFYFDNTSKKLFFWPLDNNLTNAKLSLWAGNPFAILKDVSNVRFENIIVEGVAKGNSVIEIRDSENVELAGCVIRNSSILGLLIDGGKNCGIISSDIYDVPNHLLVKGGDVKNLIPSGHYVKNCQFCQVQALDFNGRVGIEGVGQIFSNNLIHHFSGQPIWVASNDNIIEYNEVFNIGIEEGDGGTIYSGAAMWSWGNVFRRNFIHHIMCLPEAHPRGGIYLDDYDQGDTVTENVFYKAAHRSVLINGGAGQTVTSNIFLNGHIGLYNKDLGWEDNYKIQAEYDNGNLKRGDKMDYIWRCEQAVGEEGWNSKKWKEKYPLFAKIMNQEKARFRPIECKIENNCFCGNKYDTMFITKDLAGRKVEIPMESSIVTPKYSKKISMDIFKDPSTLNFGYKDEMLGKNLPEVHFDKIGLYQDKYRKNIPSKAAYRKAIKDKFADRKCFDEDAKYDPKTISNSLYFNTGELLMQMCN